MRRSRLRASAGPIKITFVDDSSVESPRLAFAIGRKVGGAVVRNRLRRRLRAISGELSDHLRSGDYLITASARATELSYGELRTSVSTALAALAERGAK